MGSRLENTLERTHFPLTNMRSVYVILAFASVVSAQFKCPKPDGTFEDGRQCDKYYECFDGIAEERLCPDGLVFDPFSNKREPCDHYFNVDCGDRLELQPPKGPNDLCPRLNGFYAHPNPNVCNIFYACVEGVTPREQGCELGLVYNENTQSCDSPKNVPECKDYYAFLEDDDSKAVPQLVPQRPPQ